MEEPERLILKRKPGERLFIGDDIEVVVLAVAQRNVTIGVVAPKDVLVLRNELHPAEQERRARRGPE